MAPAVVAYPSKQMIGRVFAASGSVRSARDGIDAGQRVVLPKCSIQCLARGHDEVDGTSNHIGGEAQGTAEIIRCGGKSQFAIVPGDRHDTELPGLTSGHQRQRFPGRSQFASFERSDESCILMGPGGLDRCGGQSEKSFAQETEGFSGSVLRTKNAVDLIFIQEPTLNEYGSQSNSSYSFRLDGHGQVSPLAGDGWLPGCMDQSVDRPPAEK